jgi:hypothetical protein
MLIKLRKNLDSDFVIRPQAQQGINVRQSMLKVDVNDTSRTATTVP